MMKKNGSGKKQKNCDLLQPVSLQLHGLLLQLQGLLMRMFFWY